MTRALVLAYHFPPVGGAGVQRIVRLARRLPELGVELVVVTGPGGGDERWTPEDASLDAGNVEVVRVPGAPARSGRWRRRRERWLGGSSPFERWWVEGAVERAVAAAPDVDVVLATMSPYESAPAAARIAEALGVPWIADLRDPWALDEMLVYPSRLHRAHAVARMGRELASAAAVVMNTPEALRRLRDAFPDLRRPAARRDPERLRRRRLREPAQGAPRRGVPHRPHRVPAHRARARAPAPPPAAPPARRRVPGLDVLTRSHVYLLGRSSACSPDPGLAEVLEVHLAGVLSEDDRAVAAGSSVVHAHGYLPHVESLELVRGADLLFLPMHDLPPGSRAGIVPGKTYEYLASGRPILAAVPDGDARDLLAEAGSAFLCRPSDVDGMAAAIRSAVDAWRRGGPPRRPWPSVVERYESRPLAASFAGLLHEVAGTPAAPRQAVRA
ncbi:MAG: glycosyltransferase [Thermoleophilia bacterium]